MVWGNCSGVLQRTQYSLGLLCTVGDCSGFHVDVVVTFKGVGNAFKTTVLGCHPAKDTTITVTLLMEEYKF